MKTNLRSIAQASKEVGVAIHTLRYWETALTSRTWSSRSHGGQRRYDHRQIADLKRVKYLTAQGYHLSAINTRFRKLCTLYEI